MSIEGVGFRRRGESVECAELGVDKASQCINGWNAFVSLIENKWTVTRLGIYSNEREYRRYSGGGGGGASTRFMGERRIQLYRHGSATRVSPSVSIGEALDRASPPSHPSMDN